MRRVSIRELRNHTGDVIASVEAGERIVLTSNGRPIADVVPHVERSRWVPRDVVLQALADGAQADRQLRDDVDRTVGGTTDDLA
ncbi:MAG: type II toxin-antitoxin system prevent-host-death family antitoxin [Actinomycetota bacterium]|nr:type II toxin-antitoxin system prevent-host-death family antitoxin [Actinomycetota bacterium]